MKKLLSLVLAVMMLALPVMAMAEDAAPEAEQPAVSTTAYIFWQDADWWPAVTSKTDDYWTPTVATVTGEGYYTVGVTAHMPSWFYSGGNHNRGAQKLAIVVTDGYDLWPEMYMQVTDVRIDGVSYPCAPVTYGQTGYDNTAEDGSYFWKANDSYALLYDQWMIDNGGSMGGGTWKSDAEAQNFAAFDASVLDDPKTIEIDFFLSTKQDVKPAGGPALRTINEGPETRTMIAVADNADTTVPENAATAKLFWDSDNWLNTTFTDFVRVETDTITGEGEYTSTITFPDQGGWSFAGQGENANKLGLVIENVYADGSIMEGMYVGISDLRINGDSVKLDNPGMGKPAWANEWEAWDEDDGVVIFYHNGVDNQWALSGNTNWEGEDANYRPMDGTSIGPIYSIEVDFFVTGTAGELPTEEKPVWKTTWFPNNTMGLAGLSLRDRGMTDKWYNVVPVDLTENGYQSFPLVVSNMFVIGDAVVTVSDGDVSVDYSVRKHTPGAINIHSECVKWFSSLDEITAEFCNNPTSDIAFGDVVSKDAIGDVGYLFICNRVTYCQPIVAYSGISLPGYYPGQQKWKDYRAELEAVMAAAQPAPSATAEEVPAE